MLLHGLLSSPKEFGLVQHPLRRAGVKMIAPELQGYTLGTGEPGRQWQDWLLAASAALDELPGHEPVVLGGLCTGAMLATALALARPQRVQGLVLLSPLLAYDGWGLPWWYRLRRIAYVLHIESLFAMREREPFGLKNEKMRLWVRQQLQTQGDSVAGPARIPLWAVRQSELLSAHVSARLKDLAVPVRTVHAREDEICSLASVERVLRAIDPARHHMSVLDNSYHMITADNDRNLLVHQLQAFVQGLGGAESAASARVRA